MSLRKSPGPSQPRDFRVDVVDDEVEPVPSAGARYAASGMGRPAELCGPRGAPEVSPLDVRKCGRGARQEFEAEVLGVERNRFIDVVDHLADVDRLIVGH